MRTEILTVTPKMAINFLKRNKNNRKVSKQTVTKYKFQMNKGQWLLSPDGLSFDTNGDVLNGQHRLHAVVDSGVSCDFVINYDVPKEVFSVIDTGKNRSGGDVLSTLGIKYPSVVAAAVKRHIMLDISPNDSVSRGAGGSTGYTHGTNTAILEKYNENPDIYNNVVADFCKLYAKMGVFNRATGSGIASYLIISKGYKYDEVMSFFNQLYTGNDVENSTILNLRNRLIKDKYSKIKMTEKYRMLLLKKTWNAYVSGSEIKTLGVRSVDSSVLFK